MFFKRVTGEEIKRLRHWARFQSDATIYDAAYLICDRSHARAKARMSRGRFRKEIEHVFFFYCGYRATTKYRMGGGLPYRLYKAPVDPIVTFQERFGMNYYDRRRKGSLPLKGDMPLAVIVDLLLK